MEAGKVYVSDDKTVTLRCSHCGRKKVFDVSRQQGRNKPVQVKCACGLQFAVTLEWRKFYRKYVVLPGQYSKEGDEREAGDILVERISYGVMLLENVSLGGIGFRTDTEHYLKVGDVAQVSFHLDDSQKSLISRNTTVIRVRDQSVGVEFCDNKQDKALAFYLML
jgi:hypothetical protein